jgi:hypothetical protein
MPRFTFNTAILTGATANPLNGWQYEYLPWNAVVRVLAQTTATGVVLGIFSGSETIQQESPVDASGAANKLPNSFIVEPIGFRAPGGDRLLLNFRNTTGGTLSVTGVVDVNPG